MSSSPRKNAGDTHDDHRRNERVPRKASAGINPPPSSFSPSPSSFSSSSSPPSNNGPKRTTSTTTPYGSASFRNRNSSVRGLLQYGLGGMQVSESEANQILSGFANDDDMTEKTWSRQFVEKYLIHKHWYNPPQPHNPDRGDLKVAWSYYEHVTLPRHYIGGYASADTVMRRAEPGDNHDETQLFHPFWTPQSSMIEWGTGVDLYFISLRFFAGLMFVAGLVNVASLSYYGNDEVYNGGVDTSSIKWMLKGSAVCLDTEWVICTDCQQEDWSGDETSFATGFLSTDDNTNTTPFTMVQHNRCLGAELENGITSMVGLVFMLACVGLFSYYLKLREIRFDEDKVTTTDYSIRVKNPPPDAIDPEEWKNFFSTFADKQVSVITIALNNENLVRKLIDRRIFRNQLKILLPKGIDLDDDDAVRVATAHFMDEKSKEDLGCIGSVLERCLFPIMRIFNFFLLPDALVEKIDKLTEEIKDLQDEKYDATHVYVTFETEQGQRNALTALTASRLDVWMNNTSNVAPDAVFQGRVLDVDEPTEPTAVRWLDIATPASKKLMYRSITLILTCGVIAFASLLILRARNEIGAWFSGPLTSIFNSSIPILIKILMIFEKHSTEGGFQASLYFKITLSRIFLSAILPQVITPFTRTLGNGPTDLLPTITGVLFGDLLITPIMRLSDYMGNLKKHVLAPRARNQEQMNRSFQGTFYNLGERYTDFTKILFVCFFYSAFYPAALFIGSAILAIQYFVDRFCLLRIWGWSPNVGAQVAKLSRRYFFTGSLIAFAVVSSVSFASFPYDNVCAPLQDNSTIDFSGVYVDVKDGNGELVNNGTVVITNSTNFIFCSQSLSDYEGFPFPATSRVQSDETRWTAKSEKDDPDRWMTPQQEKVCNAYGWMTAILVFVFLASFLGRALVALQSLFVPKYTPDGDDQHIDFSSDPEIAAYVPQIKRNGFPYPFLVCNIDDIDPILIGWSDQNHSYDFHNIIFDLPIPGQRPCIQEKTNDLTTIKENEDFVNNHAFEANEHVSRRPIYSIIKHYPTKWQLELSKKDQ